MKISERVAEDRRVLLEELRRYTDVPVIVEGKQDVEALEQRGFARAMNINRGKGLYDFSVDAKKINGDKIILILTDFDPAGEELCVRLEEYLRSVGCKTDKPARERLRKLFYENKLTTVQGLRNLVED